MGHHRKGKTEEAQVMALLETISVTKDFGGLRANDDITFSLDRGQLLGLIGPNGAGKTTLFNCISGLTRSHPVKSFLMVKT